MNLFVGAIEWDPPVGVDAFDYNKFRAGHAWLSSTLHLTWDERETFIPPQVPFTRFQGTYPVVNLLNSINWTIFFKMSHQFIVPETRPSRSSSRVANGSVGTLRTGYPRVQTSSQDNGSHLPARGSSRAVICPHGSGSSLPARDSFGAVTCPYGSSSRLSVRGSSGTATWHLGSGTHHLAHGSSRAATCPEDGFYRLQADKQISPGDRAIMISIGALTRVSSKTLRNKSCSAHL
jgi:hypothetical protein